MSQVFQSPPVPPPSSDQQSIKTLELKGNVGFASLPDQLVKKTVEHGFAFNLICVGETGIGKSTLTESLFNMKFEFQPCSYELKNVELKSHVLDIEESGVVLKLTVVETAGFGDQLDKEKSVKVISEYIETQYELYLQEEMKIKRCLQLYRDTRIHVCLYFISPTGHGLKALDVAALKDFSKRANVIPIIAKADTISKDELQRFKSKILSELKTNGIEFYKFPEDDEVMREANAKLNKCMPFAVVGSVDFVMANGKKVRARQYPWGVVEVENEEHCDFVKLREALLRLNVEDLREKTHRILYENYRRQRLYQMGMKDGDLGPGLKEIFDQKRAEHLATVKSKEEALKALFVQKVKDKENELKEKERELSQREVEDKRRFEEEMAVLKSEQNRLNAEIAEFDLTKQKFLKDQKKLKH
uniref:Septin n=1 Tax=Romanomermis culicivorax TaxID=13658 RepID=A0A915K6U7_ROMCU